MYPDYDILANRIDSLLYELAVIVDELDNLRNRVYDLESEYKNS